MDWEYPARYDTNKTGWGEEPSHHQSREGHEDYMIRRLKEEEAKIKTSPPTEVQNIIRSLDRIERKIDQLLTKGIKLV